MARIRTIKPEFWTDEKIVQLPFECRLVFIGLWNFCDDDGYLHDQPERLRMQIMPADDIDFALILDLLVSADLVERHEMIDGSYALHVPHFCDHQRISHATKSKIEPRLTKKKSIPAAERRKLATKYGCTPGGDANAACYSCGMPGKIWWPKTSKGVPGGWVAFSGLEISHFVAEANGGATSADNFVLCCQHCNRSTQTTTPIDVVLRRIPEDSGEVRKTDAVFRPERNGTERNGTELKGTERAPEKPLSASAFSQATSESLSDPLWVLSWLGEQQSKGSPVVRNSENEIINVLAAAHQVTTAKSPRNPPAVFAAIVSERRWGDLKIESIDAASKQLRMFRARGRPPPQAGFDTNGVPALTLTLDGTDEPDCADEDAAAR
jgi:hypothetical protein